MTENELRNTYVKTAKEYAGVQKGSTEHHEIVDIYNTIRPLPQGYLVKYTDAWCATFVSAMAKKCGLLDLIPAECSCPRQITLWQNKGRWQENDAYVPKVGDIIYYDWQDSGSGDNKGTPDHVGIVCEVSAGAITVIEGNMGSPSKVGYRSIAVNGKYIRGFGLPNYAGIATSAPSKPSPTTTAPKSAEIAVDGVWGQATTKKIQLVLGGLTVDGICGKLTVKALQKWAGMPEKEWDGIRGYKTNCAMQKKLNALGASPKLVVDGDFGKKSVTALQKWLNTK